LLYLAAAQRGADLSTLDGTLQTDIFKTSRRRSGLPAEPHLRLIGDLMEFSPGRSRPLPLSVRVPIRE
jgi:methylmalonyl-CoA mutase N-terminal domain/subunit